MPHQTFVTKAELLGSALPWRKATAAAVTESPSSESIALLEQGQGGLPSTPSEVPPSKLSVLSFSPPAKRGPSWQMWGETPGLSDITTKFVQHALPVDREEIDHKLGPRQLCSFATLLTALRGNPIAPWAVAAAHKSQRRA